MIDLVSGVQDCEIVGTNRAPNTSFDENDFATITETLHDVVRPTSEHMSIDSHFSDFDEWPLTLAVQQKRFDILNQLLKEHLKASSSRCANWIQEQLLIASLAGQLELVRCLVILGGHVLDASNLGAISAKGHFETLSVLLKQANAMKSMMASDNIRDEQARIWNMQVHVLSSGVVSQWTWAKLAQWKQGELAKSCKTDCFALIEVLLASGIEIPNTEPSLPLLGMEYAQAVHHRPSCFLEPSVRGWQRARL